MRRNVLFVGLAILSLSCDKETKTLTPVDRNFEPEIRSLVVQPERVLASQEVLVKCGARDRDADELAYWWVASGGDFPGGYRLPIVRWKSPPILDKQILTVFVTDLIDTVSAQLEIDLAEVASPESLRFINGSSLIDLTWLPSIDEKVAAWAGYEVYGASKRLASLPPDSLDRYRLTTAPIKRLQYRVLGVTPGEIGYYHVRSRRDYQGVVELSPSGPEIETASRLRGFGEGPLFEIEARPGRGNQGVSLPGGEIVPLDPASVGEVDLYLGTEESDDASGTLFLKSPHRLAYRDPAWEGRITGIQRIGTDWSEPIAPEEGYVEEVEVVLRGVYAIRTAEGHYAKIQISELHGSPPERRVEFQWAWQPKPNYPRF